MSTGVFMVALLIVAGGWWIPLVIWSRRANRHWHRFDREHEAAFLEEHLREHERRAARLGPRPGGSSDWRTNEALATYLRAYERTFEDCPCPYCVSMWLMCKMADSPNPRHQELAKHMAKHVSVLLVGLGLALGGMVGTAGAETTLVRTGQMWGTDKSDGKVNATLAGWVLLAPNNMGSFTTAASCEAAIVGFQAQARDGTKWVTAQQQAAQQQDELFWRQAVRRAKEQEARARGARCVERSERS